MRELIEHPAPNLGFKNDVVHCRSSDTERVNAILSLAQADINVRHALGHYSRFSWIGFAVLAELYLTEAEVAAGIVKIDLFGVAR